MCIVYRRIRRRTVREAGRNVFSSVCSIFMLMSDCIYVNFRHIINFSLLRLYMLYMWLAFQHFSQHCDAYMKKFGTTLCAHTKHTDKISYSYTRTFSITKRTSHLRSTKACTNTHSTPNSHRYRHTAQQFSRRCPNMRISINTQRERQNVHCCCCCCCC